MPNPILLASVSRPFDPHDFDDLIAAHAEVGVEVELHEREPLGMMAGMERLMPTQVMLFIGAGYFGGIVKKLGEDHYQLLKAKVKALYGSLVGPKAPTVT